MKIAVYDKVNNKRLLGHMHLQNLPDGFTVSVPMLNRDLGSTQPFRRVPTGVVQHVLFFVDRRSESISRKIDDATREVTIFERKVFSTYSSLEELMMVKEFTLPGEEIDEAAFRRGYSRPID